MSQEHIAEEERNPAARGGSQFKALFLKTAQLQMKQPCTNVCQVMTPIICLIFVFLMKTIAEDNRPSGQLIKDTNYPYIFGDYRLIDEYSQYVYNNTPDGGPRRNRNLQWYGYQCNEGCDRNVLGSNEGDVPVTARDGTLLGSVLNSPERDYVFNVTLNLYDYPEYGLDKYVPFFLESKDLNADLYRNITAIEGNSYQLIKKDGKGLDAMPDGAVEFKTLNKTKMKAVVRANDARDLDMHRNNGVTKLGEAKELTSGTWINGSSEITTPYGFLTLQHYISEAYLYVVTGKTMQSGYVLTRDTESTDAFVASLLNTISALVFPLGLSLLFPVFLYSLVLEKEQRLVQMMKMNGMRITNYWLVYFIFSMLLCLVTNLVFFLMGAFVLKTQFFEKTSGLIIVVVALGWALAQISLAAFVQTFLSKARSANIIGYIGAIWTMMIASTLNIGVYQVPDEFPVWLQILPPTGFNRVFYRMLMDCTDADCYGSFEELPDEAVTCIISLYIGALVFFLLGAYLLQVLPQEFGVRRHPLFPFIDFYRWVTCKTTTTYSKPERDRELRRYLTDDEEDPLSKAQRDEVSRMDEIDESPLVINNLRKLFKKEGYPGPYPAVKSFNLKVPAKQTFGLLGPNGAGKTTLISMLTGMSTPDYGNAWIGGYDIQNNVAKAQLEMGVCPQFDLLWPQLSVTEHLRFYARLKGTPGKLLEERVKAAIAEVNLTKFKDFLASSLSGGMKRRLSIAISLVGDPQIVFLDEPSTGLDPDNRRQIWEVLAACQEKRALFLTTHMMEQADALCHRIAIITRGTLRTIGSPLKLKKQYGEGYRMSLNLTLREKRLVSPESLNMSDNHEEALHKEDEDNLRQSIKDMIQVESQGQNRRLEKNARKVASFVLKKFPGATLYRVLGGSLVFKVPSKFKVSQLFVEMSEKEKELHFGDVSVTESSLEDVFINVVVKYDRITDSENEDAYLATIPPIHEIDDEDDDDPIPPPPSPKAEPRRESPPADAYNRMTQDRYGSAIEKERESVMSEDELRRNMRKESNDD